MLRNRSTRPSLLALADSRSDYHWKNDREEGFSEVQLTFDGEGKLISVDYKMLDLERDQDH